MLSTDLITYKKKIRIGCAMAAAMTEKELDVLVNSSRRKPKYKFGSGSDATLENTVSLEATALINIITSNAVNAAMSALAVVRDDLGEDAYQKMRMYYIDNCKFAEIAKRFGCTTRTINRQMEAYIKYAFEHRRGE